MHITNYFITNVSRFEISQMHKHGIAMKKKVKIKMYEVWIRTLICNFHALNNNIYAHQDPNDGSDLEVTPLQACE
jgi:hypothetical protein